MTDSCEIITESGVLRGARTKSGRRWLGIPYAEPLTTESRWLPAQPLNTPDAVRDATAFGDIVWQPEAKILKLPKGVRASENCLNLNVWVPNTVVTQPLPVMVWVHGGANIIGFSSQPVYNAERLSATQSVIVVTVNYRLGVLGALDFSWLLNADETAAFHSNLGLRDIITALGWVQRNIANFGGNPANVTLFGESAGGAAVTTLMTVPSARNLFHKAIAQSPPATCVLSSDKARMISEQCLELLQIDATEPGAVERLKSTPAETLVSVTTSLINKVAKEEPGTLAFSPVIDGELIVRNPIESFQRGEQAHIPLIIGSNRNEAALFKLIRSQLMPRTWKSVQEMFDRLVSEGHCEASHAEEILNAYARTGTETAALAISTDAGFRMPVVWFALEHCKIAPTFVYTFEFAMPIPRALGFGAIHAAELPYVFMNVPATRRDAAKMWPWWGNISRAHSVSQQIADRWGSFAHTSHPNFSSAGKRASEVVEWQAFSREEQLELHFGTQEFVASEKDMPQRVAWGDSVITFS